MNVGVIPTRHKTRWNWQSIPHVNGGDPETIFNEMDIQEYSPYVWGQFTISTFFDSIQLR